MLLRASDLLTTPSTSRISRMSVLDEVDLPTKEDSALRRPAASASSGSLAPGDAADDDAELEAMRARVAEMEAEAAKLREMQEQAEVGTGPLTEGLTTQGHARLTGPSEEEKEEIDARSVYVGNVSAHFCTTVQQRESTSDIADDMLRSRSITGRHRRKSNSIFRVVAISTASPFFATNLLDIPKGRSARNFRGAPSPSPALISLSHFSLLGILSRYAYVEFADASLVSNAMVLNESLFRGRLIKVTAKRTNLPGLNRGRGRGRGGRGAYRARGGRSRGRGRGWY